MRYLQIESQLTESETKFLHSYNQEITDAGDKVQLNAALAKSSNKHSDGSHTEMSQRPWVKSLHEAMRNEFDIELAEAIDKKSNGLNPNMSRNMLNHFLFKVEMGYRGSFSSKDVDGLLGVKQRGFDVDAPHMAWLRIADHRVSALKESFPHVRPKDIFHYVYKTSHLGLTLHEHLALKESLVKEDWAGHMNITEYAEWHGYSRAMFDINNTLLPDHSIEMGKYLTLLGARDISLEETKTELAGKFNIHPMYQEHINTFVDKVVELDKRNAQDASAEL
jgi:hypothetical protein